MESVLPACVCHSHATEPEVAIAAAGICPGVMHGAMHGQVTSSGSRSTKCRDVLRSFSGGSSSVCSLVTPTDTACSRSRRGYQIVIFFPKLKGEHVGRSSGVADGLWQSLPPVVSVSKAVAFSS